MSLFRFKHFVINQSECAMKVGTDAMVLGAWTDPGVEPQSILDAGTGTGVLALMMAQRYPEARIHAIEQDVSAFWQAGENCRNNSLGSSIEVIHGDYLTHPFSGKYDLIISNPPYFEQSTPAFGEARFAARHTNGFSLIDWVQKSLELLTESGALALILPADAMERLLAANLHAQPVKLLEIYGKPGHHNRSCVLFKRSGEGQLERTQLIIRENKGSYTDAYIELTREFHGVSLSR
jgi:tRNA1Val (adenine37-N6)-methyltransferase